MAVLLVGSLAAPALAVKKAADKKAGPLVIGKELKVGMSLEEVIRLLGLPKAIIVNRGTEPILDSIAIEYPDKGLVIHALTNKKKVEGIELLPNFKGKLESGLGLKSSFQDLVNKYGKPAVLSATDVRYPDKGLFFFIKDEEVVSAKVFDKKTKLLDYKLLSQ